MEKIARIMCKECGSKKFTVEYLTDEGNFFLNCVECGRTHRSDDIRRDFKEV